MRVFYGQKMVDQKGSFCYNMCIVINKEQQMDNLQDKITIPVSER